MIELGTPVRDVVTGFKGIAITRLQHLTMCDQYGVSPQATKEGKIEDTMYFDESRLVVTGKPVKLTKTKEQVQEDPGGSSRDVPRRTSIRSTSRR